MVCKAEVQSGTIVGGPGDDCLVGDITNDNLRGLDGRDQLWGRDGNDTLAGGADVDAMRGGKGADVFRLERFFTNDVILDFSIEEGDRISVYDWRETDFSGLTLTDELRVRADGQFMFRVIVTNGEQTAYVRSADWTLRARDLSEDQFIFTSPDDPALDIDYYPVFGTLADDILRGSALPEEINDRDGIDRIYGSGATDRFVMARDGKTDYIKDYEPGEEIDLKFWGVRPDDLDIRLAGSSKITIKWSDETLILQGARGADGTPQALALEDLDNALMF